MTDADSRSTLDGLAYFRKLLAGELALPPMLEEFGIRFIEVDAGRVVVAVRVDRRFYNGTGVAHGGFAATLLDTALGCAINSTASAGTRFTTLELKINLTRALTVEVGEVQCEGRVLHVGKRTAVAEARIVDRHGKLYAHGTTTCIALQDSTGSQGSRGSQGSQGSGGAQGSLPAG
jgi:uncharacterized protein (TIGR00369 family)